MYSIKPQSRRPMLAFPVIMTVVVMAHITVATPTASAQGAKPDACKYIDAAQMLQLTGRKDLLDKGPQAYAPSDIPNNTSGCHFLDVTFVLNTPFSAEQFARERAIILKSRSAFKSQSVSGVGDEAYLMWDSTPGKYRSVLLSFRSGNTRMSLEDQVASDSTETAKKWLVAFGKTAASRMK